MVQRTVSRCQRKGGKVTLVHQYAGPRLRARYPGIVEHRVDSGQHGKMPRDGLCPTSGATHRVSVHHTGMGPPRAVVGPRGVVVAPHGKPWPTLPDQPDALRFSGSPTPVCGAGRPPCGEDLAGDRIPVPQDDTNQETSPPDGRVTNQDPRHGPIVPARSRWVKAATRQRWTRIKVPAMLAGMSGHGGKRPGAGRKAKPAKRRVLKSLRLDPGVLLWLEREAKRRNTTVPLLVEELVEEKMQGLG
jgi:hypothetical protein